MGIFTVCVYERQQLIRRLWCLLLANDPNITLVANTDDVAELIELCGDLAPDVLMLSVDENFSPLQQIAHIQDSSLRTSILVVGPRIPNMKIVTLIHSCELSYINTGHATEDKMLEAVIQAAQRKIYVDESFKQAHLDFLEGYTKDLTNREEDVLKQMSVGHSNQDIAKNLGITTETVKTYMSKIYLKLHVTGRSEAIAYAYQNKLNSW